MSRAAVLVVFLSLTAAAVQLVGAVPAGRAGSEELVTPEPPPPPPLSVKPEQQFITIPPPTTLIDESKESSSPVSPPTPERSEMAQEQRDLPGPPPPPPFTSILNATLRDGRVERLFEGDMILTEEQRVSRKALPEGVWAQGVVPFVITSSSAADRAVILSAIAHWEAATCVTFIEQPESYMYGPHIRFIKDSGCWSYVGMVPSTWGQELSIGRGCEYLGIVAHEIGHALGFFHEQSRTDRETYVTVLPENMVDGVSYNFRIESLAESLGVPYDLSSLMHYGSFSFSRNGMPTIVTKDIVLSGRIGNRVGLSHRDKQLANLLYDCACFNPPTCLNGGYVDEYCTCVCPPGATGANCNMTGSYYGETCGDQNITTAGTVNSPNYPAVYPPSQHCVWIITAPAGMRVRVTFNVFKIIYRYVDVAAGLNLCPWDWMAVHTDADSTPDQVKCGTELLGQSITSTGNRLALELHSHTKTYAHLQTGFSATVTFVNATNSDA